MYYHYDKKKMDINIIAAPMKDVWRKVYHMYRNYQRCYGHLPTFPTHRTQVAAWRIVAQRKLVG